MKLNTGSYDRGAGFISNSVRRICFTFADFQSSGRLAGKKGETAEGFIFAMRRRLWADAEYAADCHCCGALSKVWIL